MKLTAKHRLALYKTAAAECFRAGGPKLTPELARESYGSIGKTFDDRMRVMQTLIDEGLVIRDAGGNWCLTASGRAAINYVPVSKTPSNEVRR